ETAEKAIRYCIRNGIYVIVDWHVHNALDPANKEKAIEFFDYISKKYGMYDNVMYELWNEPGWHDHVRFEQGIIDIPHESSVIPWNEIKDYCSDIIDVIRANDSDNIIICPSPCWDQYIEEVSKSPITSDEHLMYSFHFYAGSHLFNKNGHDGNPPTPAWLIYWSGDDSWNWTNAQNYAYSNNMTDAAKSDNIPLPTEMGKYGDDDDCPPGWDDIYKMTWSMHFEPWMKLDRTISDDNGSAKHHIPIFVTEWGTTLYDGGQPDTSDKCFINAAQEWVSYMDGHFLSWCNWSVSDKNEGASLLKPGASPNGGWSESALTTSGKYIRNKLRESY
ncbi:MAG: glycoside hydrolase family 5 protein, partial [Spirochaetia bacterium]